MSLLKFAVIGGVGVYAGTYVADYAEANYLSKYSWYAGIGGTITYYGLVAAVVGLSLGLGSKLLSKAA